MSTAALFGGSFDPPHIGHIEIIEKLKNLEFIDRVIVVPTYLNPFKESFSAPAKVRLQWLEKLFENDPKVFVSDYEVSQERKVPTYETLQTLKKEYEEIYITVGADNIPTLPKWYNIENLAKEAKFIVATRKGFIVPKEQFITIEIKQPISSTQLRQRMDKKLLPQKIAEDIYNFYKEHNATQS